MAKDAKKSAKKTIPLAGEKADANRPSLGSMIKAGVFLFLAGLGAWGYLRVRDYVAEDMTAHAIPPRVVIKQRPTWMSDALANKIVRVAAPDVAHSAFDHQLLVNTASLLRNHPDSAPWVKNVVSVRRVYGQKPGDTLEIDCEFRGPVVLVRWDAYYWLIDGDGVLLPEQYTANDLRKVMYDAGGRLNLRIIEGVMSPPPESGQKWPGPDLAAGIDMIKLLYAKPYAEEVERVNVANFGGRQDPREAQLVLITRYQTQVRWGRPVNAKDYFVEVLPAQKLDYMERLMQQFGRVDAKHSAVDLRFDRVTFPTADMQGDQANTGP